MQQHAFAAAVRFRHDPPGGIGYRQCAPEPAGAGNLEFHLLQQQIVVLFVRGFFTGKARASHTGFTAQRFHFQSAVICQTEFI